MSKIITSTVKENYTVKLVLHAGDQAVLNLLRKKRKGSVRLTITAASIDDEMVFITHKNRIYDFYRSDVFK
ncbi:MAG: hypothetical protein JWR26_3156 [Pedosphaera sp.]|nr:hypothetical protein [Pedosphaera sp.]